MFRLVSVSVVCFVLSLIAVTGPLAQEQGKATRVEVFMSPG